MSRIVTHSETFTGIPSSYSASVASYVTNPTNAYASSANTTSYAQLRNNNRTTYYTNFYFEITGISSNCSINEVTCAFRSRISNTGVSGSTQLYGANGAKESSVSISGTTNTVRTITSQNFSYSDLSSVYLQFSHIRSNSNRYIYFYGATLQIAYTWDETFYSVATSSSAAGVGISASNLTESGDTLSGNSSVITLTGVSSLSNVVVKDNGTDITSLFTVSGNNYIYTLANISADHTITVESKSTPSKSSYIKKSGSFVNVSQIKLKNSGSWGNKTINNIFWKINGIWSQASGTNSGTTATKTIEI